MLHLGLRSGEVTPSRPLSALSQQSVNSVNSGVSVRARPVAAPRRPRPFSIAVTGVTHEPDSQASRASHRHSEALCLLFCFRGGGLIDYANELWMAYETFLLTLLV